MSRDLLRLFLAQKCIWQYGTTFNYYLEVAVIVIVMRLVGTSFLCPGPFKLIFQTGTKFENRLIRGLGTSTQIHLFTLSINYSTKPGHRCLVIHLGTCLVTISLIDYYFKMVPFLIKVFFAQNGR